MEAASLILVHILILIPFHVVLSSPPQSCLSSQVCMQGHYVPSVSCMWTKRNVSLQIDGQSRLTWFVDERIFESDMGVKLNRDKLFDLVVDNKTSSCRDNTLEGKTFIFFSIHYPVNYYHFFFDTIMPLYNVFGGSALSDTQQGIILVPFVENGAKIDLQTQIFNGASYWIDMLELLFLKTENVTLMPLDENFNHDILCFGNKNVLLGLPEMKYNTYAFMNGFRNFVLQQINLLNVSKPSILSHEPRKATFVKRLGRRKIINRKELIEAVAPFLHMKSVVFDRLTFTQQIKYVKEGGNMIIGMQGAGMINSIFLEKGSSVVCLFQYNAASDSFRRMLKPLHNYYTWVNTHIKNSVTNLTLDPYHDQADTIVNVSEFLDVIKIALSTVNTV